MEKRRLIPGDVLEVTRAPNSQHFAVYIGDNKVIHYASPGGDFEGIGIIHETSLQAFIKDAEEFRIVEFSEARIEPKRYHAISPFEDVECYQYMFPLRRLDNMYRDFKYHIYSAEETIQRAVKMARDSKDAFMKQVMMSSIPFGAEDFSMPSNGSEYFAIWCKIGVKEQKQLNRILNIIVPTQVVIDEVML